MRELLALGAGGAVGWIVAPLPSARTWLRLPAACIAVGALVSAVNGELDSAVWPLLVSVDAILVYAGAVVGLASQGVRHRIAEDD